jgi:hypothetical protein
MPASRREPAFRTRRSEAPCRLCAVSVALSRSLSRSRLPCLMERLREQDNRCSKPRLRIRPAARRSCRSRGGVQAGRRRRSPRLLRSFGSTSLWGSAWCWARDVAWTASGPGKGRSVLRALRRSSSTSATCSCRLWSAERSARRAAMPAGPIETGANEAASSSGLTTESTD